MSQKNSHWKRYVFNMLLCLTSFHIVKPPRNNIEIKFGEKRVIWGLYWIVLRAKYRGRHLVNSLKEQFVLWFLLHKPAQTFQSYFLATFNTFLEKIELIFSTFIQSFSEKLKILFQNPWNDVSFMYWGTTSSLVAKHRLHWNVGTVTTMTLFLTIVILFL